MPYHRHAAHLIKHKRFAAVSSHLINWLQKEEVNTYRHLIGKQYQKLDPVREKQLKVPQDLYPSQNMPLEWWYFTGHLNENKQPRYGFEFCFFKFHPLALRVGPLPFSWFRKEPFLVFHFALTDKKTKNFQVYQDSAFVHHQHLNYKNLKLGLTNSSLFFDKKFSLRTKNEIADLKLELSPLKKIIPHFHHGYTEMYQHPSHRTYYLTYSRLKTDGQIKINHINHELSGLSWFDHQKMNIPPRSSLCGWDWFSVILDDNTELMLFIIRNKRGLTHLHLGGTYVTKNSQVVHLSPQDAQVKTTAHWQSPKTKIIYPAGWQLEIPKLKLKLNIKPCVADQEVGSTLSTPVTYWEGACNVLGQKNNHPVKGQSYVELVGYDRRLRTRLMQTFMR